MCTKGKIDRVDESQNYFRVIDYKTGSTDSTDKGLFSGTKLQLFLYGKAVSEQYKGQKEIAGLYYLPVSDTYKKQDEDIPPLADGRTLEEKQAIIEQDSTFFDNGISQFLPTKLDAKGNINNVLSKQALEHYINYAVSMSEQAVEQLKQGSIVPSPYDKECLYCKFRGLCPNEDGQGRQIEKVKEQTITGAFDSAIANQMISKGEE